MSIVVPDSFDAADRQMASTMVPDGAFVEEMVSIITWHEPDSDSPRFRVVCSGETRLTSVLGLLELAKAELLAQCEWSGFDDPVT